MSAILQCLLPPKIQTPKPTPTHVCEDDVEVRVRKPKVPSYDFAMKLTFRGETLPVSVWAKRRGISRQALYKRLDRGWPLERALTAPLGATR